MTFEEETSQYSLYECIQLTESKYHRARPHFSVSESDEFVELMAKARLGKAQTLFGRVVMDVTFIMRGEAVTGVERVALELARAFLAMADKHEMALVFIALKGDVYELQELDAPHVADQNPRFRSGGVPFQFAFGDQLLVIEIMLEPLDEYFNAISRAKRAGAVINLMVHDLIWIVNTAWVDQRAAVAYLVKWTQVLRFADRMIAVSRKVARDMACYVSETSMVGLTPTRSLPIAYCTLGCNPIYAESLQVQELNIPVDRNTFLAVGTFTTRKGLVNLFSAMEMLWSDGSEAKLVLVGKDIGAGDTRKFLSGKAANNQKLLLPAYVSDGDMRQALKQCAALVCPSMEEGFGLPLVEAAALGCPVIARDIEIFRENSGGEAFFFENGDAGEIAEGLRKWFALSRKQQLKFVPKKEPGNLAAVRRNAQGYHVQRCRQFLP